MSSKITFGVPEVLNASPSKTLLLLEPEIKPQGATKVAEFQVANKVPTIIAWETSR